ncbi:alanine dehydrogenase [Aureibaculum marinum]|uniref:Saccharopine dehydrogenase [NAD(+), L-lysine-forming] n=1 Tax=Aureibaculum marinum TaxID=2487930 RepID=A0A3N4NY25_9FLAO|nr:NAD(P)-dependent oxidoreductase [Aureibaculum marinum]RPD96469.1 alanine dehydrogenase [Aureibaculum marinum]
MKFAIIKERKNPPDRRVVLSPNACQNLVEKYPNAQVFVESSDIRVFNDDEYRDLGIEVTDDVSGCDVLLGVKEVPIENLIANKSYFFFSHTIKKQPYNRDLLKAILDKNITLYDHETVTNSDGYRLIGFGYYAGVVGAYNAFRAYGLKFGGIDLPKANDLKNLLELEKELRQIVVPPIKIVVTGTGKVGTGVREILDILNIKEVSTDDFLKKEFSQPVYVQLDALDYNSRKDGSFLGKKDFFENASEYKSTFMRFAKVSDMYIAAHFYGEGAPEIITRRNVKSPNFNIKVVADISCDINGPIAPTIRPSTIEYPIYGYNPETGDEIDYKDDKAIVVMAVDNLPCELPDNASRGFGSMFLKDVIPAFFNNDKDGILHRAKITENGKLTNKFKYLQDFVDGKE